MNKELLEAIGQMMDEKLDKKLKPIVERLDKLQGDVDELRGDVAELKEAHEITRDGVNTLLEWVRQNQRSPAPSPPENLNT